MWRNYLKIAWRNLQKNKLYSIINVLGLSTGILACLLIGLFVWNESTYDNFHENGDRIAKVYMDLQYAGNRTETDVTGTKVGPQFKRTFPQVQEFVRTFKSTHSVSNGTQSFEETGILYADSSFFKVFSFNLVSGNPATALDAPGKVLLTPEMAQKYFGSRSPLGATLKLDGGNTEYEVTGIVQPAPQNSQIQYDFLISFSSMDAAKSEVWSSANYHTYLLLQRPGQIADLEQQISPYMKQVAHNEMGFSSSGSDHWTYHLEALKDVHLHSQVSNSFEPNGNITYVYILSVVALLILLIACVNYVNMATAQSVRRSTEIGIRKVMGAEKEQLWKQFLGESFLTTLIATLFALFAGILLMPLFNELTGKSFASTTFLHPGTLGLVAILCIFISLLSGAYPAFILTRTKLAHILKSGVRISTSGGLLRKGLIVFQFSIAVFLIAATLIVGQQLSYIQNKNVGYDRDEVLVLPIDRKTRPQYERLRKAYGNLPNVISASGSYEDPTEIAWTDGINYDVGSGEQNLMLNATPVDLDYLETMGMQLVAGRAFNEGDLALQDTSNQYANFLYSFILNEQAVEEIGWSAQEAVGKTIHRGAPGVVVGVVKDFHFESLHRPIGPLLIFLDPGSVRQLFVKINAQHTSETLKAMESIWKSRVGHRPFTYHFMDEDFNRLYVSEQRIGSLFSLFSSVAIVLACLGLFALAAFTTAQRTKEIGIRKVLGAGTGNITFMLSRQFLILVGIAVVIASAIAWWAGSNWLQDFAYRIHIPWWIFVASGMFAILIALIAVSYHAIRAATTNPVHSLKDE